VSDDIWDLLLADFLFEHFAELETCFLCINSMGKESSFGIQKDSEMFISLFNSNNIHMTEWVLMVSSDFTVNFYQAFLVFHNFSRFLPSESVLQSLLKQNVQGNA